MKIYCIECLKQDDKLIRRDGVCLSCWDKINKLRRDK